MSVLRNRKFCLKRRGVNEVGVLLVERRYCIFGLFFVNILRIYRWYLDNSIWIEPDICIGYLYCWIKGSNANYCSQYVLTKNFRIDIGNRESISNILESESGIGNRFQTF